MFQLCRFVRTTKKNINFEGYFWFLLDCVIKINCFPNNLIPAVPAAVVWATRVAATAWWPSTAAWWIATSTWWPSTATSTWRPSLFNWSFLCQNCECIWKENHSLVRWTNPLTLWYINSVQKAYLWRFWLVDHHRVHDHVRDRVHTIVHDFVHVLEQLQNKPPKLIDLS